MKTTLSMTALAAALFALSANAQSSGVSGTPGSSVELSSDQAGATTSGTPTKATSTGATAPSGQVAIEGQTSAPVDPAADPSTHASTPDAARVPTISSATANASVTEATPGSIQSGSGQSVIPSAGLGGLDPSLLLQPDIRNRTEQATQNLQQVRDRPGQDTRAAQDEAVPQAQQEPDAGGIR